MVGLQMDISQLPPDERKYYAVRVLLHAATVIGGLLFILWMLFNPNLMDALGSFWDTLNHGLPEKRLTPGEYDYNER
jgi:hypothetical protein